MITGVTATAREGKGGLAQAQRSQCKTFHIRRPLRKSNTSNRNPQLVRNPPRPMGGLWTVEGDDMT